MADTLLPVICGLDVFKADQLSVEGNKNRCAAHSGTKPPSPHGGSPPGWSRAVGLAARHCCHDRHHPAPACSVVVMAMTVYLQGGTLVSNISGTHTHTHTHTHRLSEEVEVREREREMREAARQTICSKGSWTDRSHVISAGPFCRTEITQQNRRYQSFSAADFVFISASSQTFV